MKATSIMRMALNVGFEMYLVVPTEMIGSELNDNIHTPIQIRKYSCDIVHSGNLFMRMDCRDYTLAGLDDRKDIKFTHFEVVENKIRFVYVLTKEAMLEDR